MINMKILNLSNPILKKKCETVVFPLTPEIKESIQQLKLQFRQSLSIIRTLGLSAPQIGVDKRLFIMPKSMNYGNKSNEILRSTVRNFHVYINPIIISQSKQTIEFPQNCLSMPSYIYWVTRSKEIQVEYQNQLNKTIKTKMNGMRARVFLHQHDHLEGITMDTIGRLHDKQTDLINAQIYKI